MCVMCGLCEAVKFVCISVGKKEKVFFFIYKKKCVRDTTIKHYS